MAFGSELTEYRRRVFSHAVRFLFFLKSEAKWNLAQRNLENTCTSDVGLCPPSTASRVSERGSFLIGEIKERLFAIVP